MYYYEKIIIAGNFLELYTYEKSLKRDFTRKKRKKPTKEQLTLDYSVKEDNESKQLIKRKDSISRTRTSIRRIINSNQDLTKFYTLTFKENMQDIDIANRHFNKFIMRMNYHYGEFKYISIIEFQQRGAVHYHFLCNLPFIKAEKIEKIWGNGFIKIRRIKKVTNLGAYVCKYLRKDMEDERLFNKKKFFCSKNIEKPIEIYNHEVVDNLVSMYELKSKKPEWENDFENKYIGKVKHKIFKINC